MPGYTVVSDGQVGVTEGTLCPADTYRANYTLWTPKLYGANIPCTPCPANMRTLPGNTGVSSKDMCLAPPGYGWDSVNGTAYVCPMGWFNPGWNKERCTKCGGGTITTDGPGSTSTDDCYVPAGHGTERGDDGVTLSAAPCPLNTYGRESNTYGLDDVDCTKCLENTHTENVGSVRTADCVTDPGFGYYVSGLGAVGC